MTLSIADIRCPNCMGSLERKPLKKERCPLCGQLIFVKTLTGSNERTLMTEADAAKIDEEWRQIEEEQVCIDLAKQIGISRDALVERQAELVRVMGKPALLRGALGSLMNEQIIQSIKKEDWDNLSRLYFAQSILFRQDGGEFLSVLLKARNSSLKEYKARGIIKVEILCHENSSCTACKSFQGKVFSLVDMMKTTPLPFRECKHAIGYCRCVYAPVI